MGVWYAGTDELDTIRSILEGSPWVWLGDDFAAAGKFGFRVWEPRPSALSHTFDRNPQTLDP